MKNAIMGAAMMWPLILCMAIVVGCQKKPDGPAFEVINMQALPSGAYSLKGAPMLIVRYGAALVSGSFSAVLNEEDVTSNFTVVPGRQALVDLPSLREGEINSLMISFESEYGDEVQEFRISYTSAGKRKEKSVPQGELGFEGGF